MNASRLGLDPPTTTTPRPRSKQMAEDAAIDRYLDSFLSDFSRSPSTQPMTQTAIRKRRTYAVTGVVGRSPTRPRPTLQIAKLKEDESRDEILQHLITKDLAIEAGDFKAIRKVRHKEYSAATQREMLKLSNDQKWEQQQGIATDTPTTYLQLSSKP